MNSRPPHQLLMRLRKRNTVEESESERKRCKIDLNTAVNHVDVKSQIESESNSRNPDKSDERIEKTIFDTLNQECFHEVLNWLNIDSLCKFSQTCKSLQTSTKEYFRMKYPSLAIDVGDEEVSEPMHLACFGDVAQHLQLSGASITDFQSATSKINKNLREISFNRTTADKKEDHLTKEHIDCIESVLKNVKTVCAVSSMWKKGCAEYLLSKCERIEGFGFAIRKDSKYNFQFKKILTLRNLEISFDSKINPLETMKIVKKKGLHLNELTLSFASEHNGYMNSIFDELQTMFKNGIFKQLFLNFEKRNMVTEHIYRLQSMQFLKGLICAYRIDTSIDNHLADIATLKNIKYLSINYLLINADLIAKQLHQLIEVKIDEVTIDAIISFVRHTPSLRHFHNKHVRGNIRLDISKLNKVRAELKFTRKLIIYVPEEKFMKLKWSSAPVAGNLVEIQREESYIPRNDTSQT